MAGKRTSIIWNIGKNEFIDMVNKSTSTGELLKKFGLVNEGKNNTRIHKRISEEKIDISHFESPQITRSKTLTKSRHERTLNNDDIFIEHSSTTRNVVRTKILKQNLIPYKCSSCGIVDSWMGKSISLQLDHINGVCDDHRLHNLQWLCPNCHSQTSTYAGRNTKPTAPKVQLCIKCGNTKKQNSSSICFVCASSDKRKCTRPTVEQLLILLENNSFVSVGKMFGVSDNTIRKWIKKSKGIVGIEPT